jgi:hypothetical protein
MEMAMPLAFQFAGAGSSEQVHTNLKWRIQPRMCSSTFQAEDKPNRMIDGCSMDRLHQCGTLSVFPGSFDNLHNAHRNRKRKDNMRYGNSVAIFFDTN